MTAVDANDALTNAIDGIIGYGASQGATYVHVDVDPGSSGIHRLCVSIDDTNFTSNVVAIDQTPFDTTDYWKTSPF